MCHTTLRDRFQHRATRRRQAIAAALADNVVKELCAPAEGEVKSIQLYSCGATTPFALPRPGQRFGDWEIEQCGKLVSSEVKEEIPIPFAPVMAGVLVAGAVIKAELFPGAGLDSCYWNTLVGRFMHRNHPTRRTPRDDGPVCQSKAFRSQYVRRWGEATREATS